MKQETRLRYRVVRVTKETEDVSTLDLEIPEGELPAYTPGQYLTVYFPESGTPEGKAYTISSAPSEKRFSLSVKAMGEFSHRLVSMRPGDTVTASLPYGYFYSESQDAPLVMIAGGIGVSPFRSMIVDIMGKNPARRLLLLYSGRTLSSMAFKGTFDELSRRNPTFQVRFFVTREEPVTPDVSVGRINGRRILEVAGDTAQAEFLICGSIPFARDLWRELKSLGVPEENMYTEAFFSH
ncbi:MAG: FAD-binding oxidoreductase [Candidatus Paceibacterota bacterium]